MKVLLIVTFPLLAMLFILVWNYVWYVRDWNRKPIPMVLACPNGHAHIDEGEWATRPHKTHQCQVIVPWEFKGTSRICGLEWRPAEYPTVGVEKL